MKHRKEHDLLGEMAIPVDAYYGIHAARAAENFHVSNIPIHKELIVALALVKQAAARTNMQIGRLPQDVGDAVCRAAMEVANGYYHDQFIVGAFQGGAGTSTNMNMNEVLANRAIELLGGWPGDYGLVHPLEHVNLSQSTNDVYPTALRVAAIRLLLPLSEACAVLQGALQEKEAEFAGIVKVGRTQLQEAIPITLGQEFAAYAEAVARDRWRLYKVEERLRQINLGGTAVGTGLGADKRFIYRVVEQLRVLTGIGLARNENLIDGTQNADVFVEVSGLVKAAAVTLLKISGDLILLSSGPRAGFGEITLPQLQAGSSIMPGKINPVLPEMVTQVAYQVMAQDLAVSMAAQAGQLELNAFLPLVAANLLPAMETLAKAIRLLVEKCIRGIRANAEKCREYLQNSTGIFTLLATRIGYERASELARQTLLTERSARDIILEAGILTEEELEKLLTMEKATKTGYTGE